MDARMRKFQSQTRSRSTCDLAVSFRATLQLQGFNLRREAAPHATHSKRGAVCAIFLGFNLRREAAPHATPSVETSMPRVVARFNLRREAAPHATCISIWMRACG